VFSSAKTIHKNRKQYINFLFLSAGCSVADPGRLSRILIFTHSGSRISYPKTATKERGEKKFVVKPFFVPTNFTKLKMF
jgi:hypothetical protein